MSDLAVEIIALRDSERNAQANFRSLWQETADLIFPRQNQITSLSEPGEDKAIKVYDTTAIQDSQDMVSGMSGALIPAGQKFFGLKVRNPEISEDDDVQRFLLEATEITHAEMFESNFMLQFNETLRSMVVFGTGNLYSEWDGTNGGLNYKDYDIANYQILEDAHGRVNTVILTLTLTPLQVMDMRVERNWGMDKISDDIKKALEKPDTSTKKFEFIHIVRPRRKRSALRSDSMNMPFESIFVDVKAKMEMDQGGFTEFPFAVARWTKSSSEKYGRGQGTENLPAVKVMQQIHRDFLECGNKWNNPPREVLAGAFEGDVNVAPGGLNWVNQFPAIKGLDQTAMGNFPITKDVLEFQQEVIHKAFFRDIFIQMADLRSTRMTTVEVAQRVQEGLRRLASPVSRIQSELLNPVVTRSVLLLVRNGRIPYPPPQLQGQQFGIEYEGQLALALRDQQAKGFMQWAAMVTQIANVQPDVLDYVDWADAMPRLGISFGVHSGDMATPEQVAEKREERRKQQAAAELMQAAEVAGKAYGPATKTAEEGSLAGELMGAGRG